ncbi:MAG: hypothetical protein MJA84_11735 [Firmicutes bacterium]|nr:hypothetical protein [Bacillota bacterium]
MQWQGMKIHIVLASVVIALAAFIGAQWLYNSLNFREPLKKELNASAQVLDYRIEDAENGSYRVVVTIRETDNLMLAYRQIKNAVQQVMGDRQFVIELVDRRDTLLTEVYNQGQFAVQEALVQGNFREMAGSLDEYARTAGVESRVYIDGNNIYWQMSHGDHHLHAVFPRHQPSGARPGDSTL